MKITTHKTLLLALIIFLVLPSFVFASWWNPLSWFNIKTSEIIQPTTKEISHQDLVASQPSSSVVMEKKVLKAISPIISPNIIVANDSDQVKALVIELIQQYLSPEELERIRSVTNHTTASYDPDKAGLQLAYIPGSMIADDGTYFSATNLSSGNLTADEATLGSISSSGNLSVEGNTNLSSTNIRVLEIGSSSQPVGITIYDTVTQQPFCITSENSSLTSTAGKCSN